MRSHVLSALLVSILAVAGCSAAPAAKPPASPTPTAAQSDVFTPVLGRVLNTPQPVISTDGTVHIAYELLLSNVLPQAATIDSVAVQGNEANLLTLTGDQLLPWTMVYGSGMGQRVIGAGQQALVWLDVTVATLNDVPATLDHVITISVQQPEPPIITSTMVETMPSVAIDTTPPIVIGPPLQGDNWFDANGCCAVTPHRGALNPLNGVLSVPERFAIDYVQLDQEGRIFDGDITALSSYKYYGANILAVGDGPIISMVTDLKEQTPGANPSGLPLGEYGGNNIVQDIGNGHYAFYAHLQADNPKDLKIGQTLKKGEVIGLLGNTGNTDTPHLHFHIMDSPNPIASNGLPFVIDSFTYGGRVVSTASFDEAAKGGKVTVDTSGSGKRAEQFPLYLDVMSY